MRARLLGSVLATVFSAVVVVSALGEGPVKASPLDTGWTSVQADTGWTLEPATTTDSGQTGESEEAGA